MKCFWKGEVSGKAEEALEAWVRFLEGYAGLLGRRAVPAPLKLRRLRSIADARAASRLAREAREALEIDEGPLPGLLSLLEGLGCLVHEAPLGEGLLGAFYPHPVLGPALLVNAEGGPERRTFAALHLLAHALYHKEESPLLCSRPPAEGTEELEGFANRWAAHFLVPGKALRRLAREWASRAGGLFPEVALLLARRFGVGYRLLLFRLKNEGLISEEEREAWARLSPEELEKRLGLPPKVRTEPPSPTLLRHPPSVLLRVENAVRKGRLSREEAEALLGGPLPEEPSRRQEEDPEVLELAWALDFVSPGRKAKLGAR